MFPHRSALSALLVFCVALAGCATTRRPKPAPTPAAPHQIGAITLVNTETGFVLIDTSEMPQPGSTLRAQSQEGQETAVLKASAEQKPPFATADITSGTPQPGDRVFTH